MKKLLVLSVLTTGVISSCQLKGESDPSDPKAKVRLPEWQEPKRLAYEIRNAKQWLLDSAVTSGQRDLVYAINRTDKVHFRKMDTVIVPVDLSGDISYYFPFPSTLPYLKEVNKIVFFSYAAQTFAAYENGILVQTGPTNMGRENAQTPTGLFFTNWKAKKTISTVNDEWELKWNFNILNKEGIGWHQYAMPGYPASHSCLRLTEKDAKFLYYWADQWVLADRTKIRVKGTPVIVFGNYDFSAPKPWLKLVDDPHALDLDEAGIEKVIEPVLYEIMREQKNREEYEALKNNSNSIQ